MRALASPATVPDRTRRALLRGEVRARPVLRPPWTHAEARFAATCTACDACIAACPSTVLVRGEGGMPEFDPALGECSFCGDCAAACPEDAFVPVAESPWTLRAQPGDACLAARGIVCWSCRDACGASAIRFAPTRAIAVPRVDAAACTGCGACVAACPSAAITLSASTLEAPVGA